MEIQVQEHSAHIVIVTIENQPRRGTHAVGPGNGHNDCRQ